MSGDDPDACVACLKILQKGRVVNPDAFDGGLGALQSLDKLGIYKERLSALWVDVCKRDVGKILILLEVFWLVDVIGVDAKALNHAIDNRGDGIDFNYIAGKVKSIVGSFDPAAGAT